MAISKRIQARADHLLRTTMGVSSPESEAARHGADPFTDDDFDPEVGDRWRARGSAYSRPEPEHRLRDSRKSDESLAREYAEQRDATEGYRAMVHPIQERRTLLNRLQGAQFVPAVPGLAETHERMRENPPEGLTRPPKVGSLAQTPLDRIGPANWRPGMGETWTERNFSPQRRAQGHLLGAAGMFITALPGVGRPNVDVKRY